MGKKLRWLNTKYSMSLGVSEDAKFYEELLEKDPEAAAFFYDFHNDSYTNDPTSTWGKARRNARRKDVYQQFHRLPYDESNTPED